jgi:hypothetical protein
MSRAEKLLGRLFLGWDISTVLWSALVWLVGEGVVMGLLLVFVDRLRNASLEAQVCLGIGVGAAVILANGLGCAAAAPWA